MKLTKILIGLATFIITACPIQAATVTTLQPLLDLPDAASEYSTDIHSKYSELRTHLKQSNSNDSGITEYLELFRELNALIKPELSAYNDGKSAENCRFLAELLNNFDELATQTSNIFGKAIYNKIVNQIQTFYPLFKIHKCVAENSGWLGGGVWNNMPDPTPNKLLQTTMKNLLGRIFVVDKSANKILSTSTGMLMPSSDGAMRYDRVVTCAHNMEATDTNPNLIFYFVRADALDDATGMPKAIAGTEAEIITYLEMQSKHGNNVRRILCFDAFAKQPYFHITSYMEDHSPRYKEHQDCGYARLEKSFDFDNTELATVTLIESKPVSSATNYDYYAIGYPLLRNTSEIIARAPLCMTKARSRIKWVEDSIVSHIASTAQGQSGGPIVRFYPDHIEILGLIAFGEMDDNYLCKFW